MNKKNNLILEGEKKRNRLVVKKENKLKALYYQYKEVYFF